MTPFWSWTRPKALLACGVGDIPLAPVPNSPRSPWAQAVFQVPQGHSHTTSLPRGFLGYLALRKPLARCHPRGSHVSPQFLGSCLTLRPGSAPGSGVASPGEAASWSTQRHRLPYGERAGLHVEIHL